MNPTIKLLRTIGSPFVSDRELPGSKDEALELYDYATKNKIGLAYLESIKDQAKLAEFGLESKFQEERKRHNDQLITAIRVSELFNSFGVRYAIFKTIMPYPATPNDVDIIHFGTAEDFETAVETMLQSNYIEVKGQVDAEQRMFHDARSCEHPDPNKKDVYDVDVYHEISASYVLYLDKRKLEKYVTEIFIAGSELKILVPEAELVTIIIHSIVPEMLCTLFVYYATLYHLARMNTEEIERFIEIAKENNVTFSVKAHCSLVAELHNIAHGFVPAEIGAVLARLGEEKNEVRNLLKNDFKMPHRYGWSAILRSLLEKRAEAEFRRSAIRQARYMMLNPRLAKWVISEVILRRGRETY
jgi:hypothetical protein